MYFFNTQNSIQSANMEKNKKIDILRILFIIGLFYGTSVVIIRGYPERMSEIFTHILTCPLLMSDCVRFDRHHPPYGHPTHYALSMLMFIVMAFSYNLISSFKMI